MAQATEAIDRRFMAIALALARRGLGRVWPRPSVGCVIVAPGGAVLTRGWTQAGGRPHAEAHALAFLGAAAGGTVAGATAYVSLEPCAHAGSPPKAPCAQLLAEAGIARVVVAMEDPDPRVSGRGLALLRERAIAVSVGVLAREAAALNAGFVWRVGQRRPLVTLKLAMSLDGRIGARTGASRWITGEAARAYGHGLRASHDGVLIGIGTARADDPLLTCRLPGMAGRSPVRIVVDPELALRADSNLARSAGEVALWLVARADADRSRVAVFERLGCSVIGLPGGPDIDPAEILAALAERGLTRLLIEGGGVTAARFLHAGLVDRLELMRAPVLLGGDAIAAPAALGIDAPGAAPRWQRDDVRTCDDDLVESYSRVA